MSAFSSAFPSKGKTSASLTVEHGLVKLMVSSGQVIKDYRVVMANPRYFKEGHVSNAPKVAGLLENVLPQLAGKFKSANAVVPGFQSRLRVLEFPKGAGFDPRNVLTQEAARTMHVTPDKYYITWHRLPDNFDRTRWLVLAAMRRAIASISETAQRANLRISALELRPFALARAINQPEAIIAWAAPDGCDVVIVKNSVPVEHQSQFWGADLVEDSVLVRRLTDVTSRTLETFNESSPEGPMPDDTPLYVAGSPISRQPMAHDDERGSAIAQRICQNLRLPTGEFDLPMDGGPEFPLNDLIVNAGLALRGA